MAAMAQLHRAERTRQVQKLLPSLIIFMYFSLSILLATLLIVLIIPTSTTTLPPLHVAMFTHERMVPRIIAPSDLLATEVVTNLKDARLAGALFA